MSAKSLAEQLLDRNPFIQKDRTYLEEAGFNGFSDRTPGINIENVIVTGSSEVVWHRSNESKAMVVGKTTMACDDLVTDVAGSSMKIIRLASSSVVANGDLYVTATDGGFAAGGHVYVNGIRVGGNPKNEEVVVFLTGPRLTSVCVLGSGKVFLQDVDQHTLHLRVEGSGCVEGRGSVERLIANVLGSGDIDAEALAAKSVDCDVYGSGDINVQAIDQVRALVTGSGDIVVRGEPDDRNSRVTGSGRIQFKKK